MAVKREVERKECKMCFKTSGPQVESNFMRNKKYIIARMRAPPRSDVKNTSSDLVTLSSNENLRSKFVKRTFYCKIIFLSIHILEGALGGAVVDMKL